MTFDATKTVREFAVEVPNATRVFEKLGIDYCCGGGKSLQDACTQASVSVDEVLRTLQQGNGARQVSSSGMPDVQNGRLSDLVDHIVATHHVYVKQEVPRLQQLIAKVVSVHGQNHPELHTIQETFQGVGAELMSHMMKEEQILFPYIADLDEAASQRRSLRPPMFGTIRNPVHMMEMEHDAAGDALKTMRGASQDYTPPAEACISYKTLYSALLEFEADLHQHIHLENNVLFPRAIKLESELL